MPLGFNLLLWTTHVTDEHWPTIEALAKAGYDGVEVPVFEGDPEDYRAIGQRLSDLGLRSTTVGVIGDGNPIAEDGGLRKRGRANLSWLVECSQALGAEVLCGPFHQPLAEFTGAGPTEGEFERCVEAHRAMAEEAGSLTLAVEPLNRFECYFLNTASQAARLVEAVDRANYGYLYDTFHFNIEEKDPVEAIGATARAISHVHISENDRGTPGRGHIDFAPVFERLRANGYDGWLVVEAFGQALPDLAAATKVWRPFFGSEREVYEEGLKLMREGWNGH